jgi:hypothetical protein
MGLRHNELAAAIMRKIAIFFAVAVLFNVTNASAAQNAPVAHDPEDYTGPFTTQVFYTMCSRNDAISREKCYLYIQGLLYGITRARLMHERGLPVCLPEMTPETARLRILNFINGTTAGKPSNNKDGGDWMAFLGIAAGNTCKQ